jgi:hypothetical protein
VLSLFLPLVPFLILSSFRLLYIFSVSSSQFSFSRLSLDDVYWGPASYSVVCLLAWVPFLGVGNMTSLISVLDAAVLSSQNMASSGTTSFWSRTGYR